jgi:uroporphyrinogen-III synthase
VSAGRLAGLGIVLTRPHHAAEAFAAPLAREGARVIQFPTLAIEDIPVTAALERVLARLASFDLAIFVSANAVEKGLAAARRAGTWPPMLRVAAIGEATAEALRNSGIAEVITPAERHDSEALLGLAPLQVVKDRDIVIFRGEGGRGELKDVLAARGAHVEYAECYRRVRPRNDPAEVVAALARGEVHAVSALSAETLENFVAMIGAEGTEKLSGVTLVVPHVAVGANPEARRFARTLIAAHGPEGLINALTQLRVTT